MSLDYTGLPLSKGRTRRQGKAKRDRAEAKVVRSVRNQAVEAANYACERCGQWTGTWGHAHHKIPRSRGGQWVLENIAYVCATCHAAIHRMGCRSVAEAYQALGLNKIGQASHCVRVLDLEEGTG